MKRLLLCAILVFVLQPNVVVAEDPLLPFTLAEVGKCLVGIDQNWLGNSTADSQRARFAWMEDRKSSPGERHLYLLAQLDAGTTHLFDIRFESRHRKHIYTLEEKLEIVREGDGEEFVTAPSGGPRMSKLYRDAIQEIRHRFTYDVQLNRLRRQAPNVVCKVETGK